VRILVTGAGGFIGRHLLRRLESEGHDLTALLLPGESADGLAAARVLRGDITDPASLEGPVTGRDAVVHLAAAVGYGQTRERCRRINRDGTANVASAAARAGARRFVHLSSVSVYGRPAGVPIAEDAPLRMTGDPYGDTKIEAERILRRFAERGELDLTVLRPVVIYGEGDDKFLPKLVENLRSGRARIVGRGDNRVDAVHVDDVVELVARVLADPKAVGAVYNVNHPGNPTWSEFVADLSALLGIPAPRRRVPYRAALLWAGALELTGRLRGREPRLTRYAVRVIGRRTDYRTERAREDLGFVPRIDLRQGVRRSLAPLPRR
jgi:nucleoside-diphosphate-sugar epimerase